jgi:hypothetical protein
MKFLASALLALVFVAAESTLGQESAPGHRALTSTTLGLEKTLAAQNSDPQDIPRGLKSYYISKVRTRQLMTNRGRHCLSLALQSTSGIGLRRDSSASVGGLFEQLQTGRFPSGRAP